MLANPGEPFGSIVWTLPAGNFSPGEGLRTVLKRDWDRGDQRGVKLQCFANSHPRLRRIFSDRLCFLD